MKDYTTKLLDLEDVIVKNIWEDEVSRHIEIELPRKEHCCPCCGELTNKVHDYRSQCIKDCPAFGKQVYLHLRKRRYICTACGKRFYESNSFVPCYYRVTSRKCAQIINDFREAVSASHIAREHNISVSTALRYFNLVSYNCKRLPTVLSIDEFKGNAGGEKYQCIIADAANHRPVDILPNRKKSELIRYFCGFESRKDVKYVVIDMNAQFRDVAELCFPNATIVIDRFHITRQALWAMERVRKAEQKALPAAWRKFFKRSRYLLFTLQEELEPDERGKLHRMLGLSTKLELAYDLKNDFLEMLHAPNSKAAAERMADWVYNVECSSCLEFRDCTRALHNWSHYILNGFDCAYTNGFTEGCNNKTKVLKIACYGVQNFSRFRNRILHCARLC